MGRNFVARPAANPSACRIPGGRATKFRGRTSQASGLIRGGLGHLAADRRIAEAFRSLRVAVNLVTRGARVRQRFRETIGVKFVPIIRATLRGQVELQKARDAAARIVAEERERATKPKARSRGF